MSAKIVFTGGHHNSALAVALDLRKLGCEIYWLGHKYSMWGDKNPSLEYKEITAAKIPFFELKAGKFHRTYSPIKLARIPVGFVSAARIIRKIKPDLIVSFGSYLAVPVSVVGWLAKIPVITHEQTSAATISNQVISHFAKKIFITFASSFKYFPKNKTKLIGLPLSDDIVQSYGYGTHKIVRQKDLIFFTGGKQGAHNINVVIARLIPELLKKYRLIHQTGSSTVFDDYSSANHLASTLPGNLKNRYRVVDFLPRNEMNETLAKASLVISRSGAHMIYELGLLGTPSILIPIPTRTKDEQTTNAMILKEIGSAEIIKEKDLTPDRLRGMIKLMMENLEEYGRKAQAGTHFFPLDAKEKMVEEVKSILRNR